MNKFTLTILLIFLVVQTFGQGVNFTKQNSTLTPVTAHKSDSDLGPEIIDGILYFSSLRTEEVNSDQKDPFFDLFSVPLNEAVLKNAKRELVKPLCTEFHDGPISYCETTGELFVTLSDIAHATGNRKKSVQKTVPLKIGIYQKEGDEWIFKEEFPFNNPPYSVGHPAINFTGDTLVFASDQPGGYGKSDLYLTVRKEGIWQKPQNMGPNVNTKHHEITPFIDNDGVLYFASDGLRGKGKLDIYSVKLSATPTTRPVDLPGPINSRSNDYGLVLHPNRQIGYLVSNRHRGKSNDAIFCLKKRDFIGQNTALDSTLIKTITAKEESCKEEMAHILQEKQADNPVFNSLEYHTEMEITDKKNIPDLKITYWYTITNDTLKFGENTFAMGKYAIRKSEAATTLLAIIKENLENGLREYIAPDRQIDVLISSEPDAMASGDTLRYEGEYGEIIQGTCLIDQKKKIRTIESQSALTNQLLAMLRAYGIGQAMKEEIDPMKKTFNTFQYQLIPEKELYSGHHWNTIEITLHNAFANF